jgi:hypothetical protein
MGEDEQARRPTAAARSMSRDDQPRQLSQPPTPPLSGQRRKLHRLARARTVTRIGVVVASGILLVGTLGACGSTKTVTKTVTVV